MSLDDSVALVTGGAAGIGRAIALRLAAEGAHLVVADLDHEQAQAVAEQINTSHGAGRALALAMDVTSQTEVEAAIQQARQAYGDRIDILVNNAGITRDALLLRMSPEAWDEVLNVNLRGAYLCTKCVLPHMVRARYGRIVSMSSVVGLSGNPGQANYAASKAGLIGFTKALAREVASRNITVNAVAPGYITTSMVHQLPDEVKSQVLSRIPMGRFGTPEDVAEVVAFLCSREAAYVTGQVIGIDGGLAI